MATGTAKEGNTISVGDEITTSGNVTSISGSGSKALVTVLTHSGDTIVVQANDCYSVQSSGAALSICGKPFGVGDPVTVMGFVTGITGSGQSAKVTTSAKSSATPVTHTASASRVPKKN